MQFDIILLFVAIKADAFMPSLPKHYQPNLQAESYIIEILQNLKAKYLNGWIILHGPQGSGKTTLVNQFIRNQAAPNGYLSGGVLWISLGNSTFQFV